MTTRTALLIVDMQRSLLDEETWEPDRVLSRVAALEAAARAGAPVVWITDSRVEPNGDLHPTLQVREGDVRVSKDFCDAFLGTPLEEELSRLRVGHLVVCGLHTDFCIDTTCRRAASLGYRVTLAGDAHSTFDREGLSAGQVIRHHNLILADFPAGTGSVAVSDAGAIDFA